MQTKEYTRWRQFLAWVGFFTIIFAFPAITAFVIWAKNLVGTAIAEQTQVVREHNKLDIPL